MTFIGNLDKKDSRVVCPYCKENIDSIESTILKLASVQNPVTSVTKMMHKCPKCFSVLAITDY